MNKVEKNKELIQTAAALISRRVTSTDMDFQQWKSSVDRMLEKNLEQIAVSMNFLGNDAFVRR